MIVSRPILLDKVCSSMKVDKGVYFMELLEKLLRSRFLYSIVLKIDAALDRLRTKYDLLERDADKRIFEHFLTGNYSFGAQDFGPEFSRKNGKNVYFLTDVNIDRKFSQLGTVISNLDAISDQEIAKSVFYVYFSTDSMALEHIRRILKFGGSFVPHLNPSKTEFRFTDEKCLRVLRKVRDRKDFSPLELSNIYFHENICEALFLTRELEGVYLEIGVYQGHSLLTASLYIDELISAGLVNERSIHGLDTFHGFDYLEAKSTSDIIWEGSHIVNTPQKQIEIIKGKIENKDTKISLFPLNIVSENLPHNIEKIAVAVVDVDLYEATLQSLFAVEPHLLKGGIIICEDPASTPQLYGSFVAMEDFLCSTQGKKFLKIFKKGSYFLIKLSE